VVTNRNQRQRPRSTLTLFNTFGQSAFRYNQGRPRLFHRRADLHFRPVNFFSQNKLLTGSGARLSSA